MVQSLELTLAQLAGLNRQQSAEASAALLLAQVQQWINAGMPAAARSATLVVAASDASALSRFGADYICNGTADEVQVNLAMAALNALGGGRLVLVGPTFYFAATADTVDNVLVEGDGYGTEIRVTAQVNAFDIVGVDNVEICYLQINGDRGSLADLGNSNLQHGIYSNFAVNCKLHDLWIHDCWEQGIFMNGSSDGFQVWAVHSYANHHNGIGGYDCEDTQVWGCLCYDAVAGSGLDFDDCIRCTIGPIICHSNAWNGINVYSTASATIGVKVISPICYNNGQAGVYVHGPLTAVTVSDPNCTGNALGGVMFADEADDSKVTGGICNGNTQDGVQVDNNSDRVDVLGVTTLGNGWVGVKINSADCHDCRIEGCRTEGGAAPQWTAITDSGTGTIIQNNPGGPWPGETGRLEGWVLDDAQNPLLGILPANVIVTAVDVWVEEAFNAGGADDSLTVGYDALTNAYLATGLNMRTLGLREHVTESHGNAGATMGTVDATSRSVEAYLTHTGGEPNVGKCYVVVHYMVATAEPA